MDINVPLNSLQISHFNVHLESLPSQTDRSRFAMFLQHGHLTADVYDGDSLILLGVAKVPLAVSTNHAHVLK